MPLSFFFTFLSCYFFTVPPGARTKKQTKQTKARLHNEQPCIESWPPRNPSSTRQEAETASGLSPSSIPDETPQEIERETGLYSVNEARPKKTTAAPSNVDCGFSFSPYKEATASRTSFLTLPEFLQALAASIRSTCAYNL